LPVFCAPTQQMLRDAIEVLLLQTELWGTPGAAIDIATVTATANLMDSVVKVFPVDGHLNNHRHRIRNILNDIGAAAIKRSLVDRAKAVIDMPENLEEEVTKLAKCCETVCGVDLALHASELRTMFEQMHDHIFQGKLRGLEESLAKGCIENLINMAASAGDSACLATFTVQLDVETVIRRAAHFSAFVAGDGAAATKPDAAKPYADLLRAKVLLQTSMDAQKDETRTYAHLIDTAVVSNTDAELKKCSEAAVRHFDEQLNTQAQALVVKVGCNPETFEMEWPGEASTVAELSERMRDTLLKHDVKTLKQEIASFHEVLSFNNQLIMFAYVSTKHNYE